MPTLLTTSLTDSMTFAVFGQLALIILLSIAAGFVVRYFYDRFNQHFYLALTKTPMIGFWVLEIIVAALSCWILLVRDVDILSVLLIVLIRFLAILSDIDLRYRQLPDRLTLPLIWLGLITNNVSSFTPISSAIWGAVLGYLLLWAMYWTFRLMTGREGVGYGDFKLLAALGAWGGIDILLPTLMGASVLAVVGYCLTYCLNYFVKLKQTHPVTATSADMAFGPYLAIAGLICILAKL